MDNDSETSPADTTPTEPPVWALGWLNHRLNPDDLPPIDMPDGGHTIINWLMDQGPKWAGTEDDLTALGWLKDRLEEGRPCIVMRGPPEPGTRTPNVDDDSTIGIISLPVVGATTPDEPDRVTQQLVAGRRNHPASESRTEDKRGGPPREGDDAMLAETAEHLMGELPEISETIRRVMIEARVKGTT